MLDFDRPPRLLQVHPEKSTLLQELRLIRQEWQQRNEAMADKIEGYAKQYAGKRLVTVVGAEHRYLLRDLLRNRKGLTLKEYWELR